MEHNLNHKSHCCSYIWKIFYLNAKSMHDATLNAMDKDDYSKANNPIKNYFDNIVDNKCI